MKPPFEAPLPIATPSVPPWYRRRARPRAHPKRCSCYRARPSHDRCLAVVADRDSRCARRARLITDRSRIDARSHRARTESRARSADGLCIFAIRAPLGPKRSHSIRLRSIYSRWHWRRHRRRSKRHRWTARRNRSQSRNRSRWQRRRMRSHPGRWPSNHCRPTSEYNPVAAELAPQARAKEPVAVPDGAVVAPPSVVVTQTSCAAAGAGARAKAAPIASADADIITFTRVMKFPSITIGHAAACPRRGSSVQLDDFPLGITGFFYPR